MSIFSAVRIISPNNIPHNSNPESTNAALKHASTDFFVTIGALAFFMLVLAGFKYVISEGEPAKVSEAKKQILYSIIGIAVAALAGTLVNFILEKT